MVLFSNFCLLFFFRNNLQSQLCTIREEQRRHSFEDRLHEKSSVFVKHILILFELVSSAEIAEEKFSWQKRLRFAQEERNVLQRKLKTSETTTKQLQLEIHQIKLQYESSQHKMYHTFN